MTWTLDGDIAYMCTAKNLGDFITDRSNRVIHSITGTHENNKTNDDVKAVWITSSNVFYFPLGLGNLFKNLLSIGIQNSKLREISKEDLKEFPKLKRLDLFDNEIEIVDEDLFQYNPKLEDIGLNKNKISQIDPKVFKNFVNKLNVLFLSENVCQLNNAYYDKQKANELIAEIQAGKCENLNKN